MTVLDASAMLALLLREPGHERVTAVLADCCLSTVNLSEVLGRFERDGHDTEALRLKIQSLPVEIVAFEAVDASAAASLIPATRSLGLSLGDRACLALARSRGIPAMTADRAWAQLQVDIEIRVIR